MIGDTIKVQLSRISDEGTYGVSITDTPEVDGYMFSIFLKSNGSCAFGHWICKHTPDDVVSSIESYLKSAF